MERLLNVHEVAARIGCTTAWAYQLAASGELKTKKFGTKNRGMRFLESSVTAYIASRQIPDVLPVEELESIPA